jgi:stearoyl-CoA desaturase (delta-9 desaturase)
VLLHLLLALVVAAALIQVAVFSTTIYLHRCATHKALIVHPSVEWTFKMALWLTTGQCTKEWVAVHRKHHASTDTDEDPHSPMVVGFWRVQLGNVGLYKRAARDDEMVRKYARDIPTDRVDRLAFDYSLAGLGIGITILVVVMWALGFGLLTGFVAAGLHAVLYVMLAGAINAVGHQYGERPYRNSGTNLRPLALVTGGEGLHNNHHAAPTSARFSLHRGELDPGWWVVRALTAMRLAHVRHDDVHMKPVA